ncbi:protein of unknown function [Candidatus Nitrotoga arctica]|uniref:Uncharacterized protein n=1 Tax=Candidatus Nitrotoga arctica TaxID=453162 RepID=A0ABN8AM91_9PROT|nr:protein of unknown function [Candidatus Nitrotoga arctica]
MRDVTWRFAQRLCQLHRKITGVIAMQHLFGALDQDVSRCQFRCNNAHSLRKQFGKMGFEIQDGKHYTTLSQEARIIALDRAPNDRVQLLRAFAYTLNHFIDLKPDLFNFKLF